MKLGILKTGDVNLALVEEHGEYAAMFARLLHEIDPEIEFFTVDIDGGQKPGEPGDADGWIITGSRHGVYEDHPWIPPLKDFLRAAISQGVPVAGICFGHQILAEALGGKVVKSDKGWGLGRHEYQPVDVPSWLDRFSHPWAGHAVHQDQIVELAPDSTVLASSPFCEYAAIAYGDPERPKAISVQAHPEFTKELVRDLIEVRLKHIVPEEITKMGHDSLGQPVNDLDWAKAIVTYFRKVKAGAESPGVKTG